MIQLSCYHQQASFELCNKVLINISLAVLYNLTYNGYVKIKY